MSIRFDSVSVTSSWADIASSVVGAPPGFKLFRYSPLGWPPRRFGSLTELSSPWTPSPQTQFQRALQWSAPTLWFSLYTPCPRTYELKHCRRVLANSAVEAVDRALRRQSTYGMSHRVVHRRGRVHGSAVSSLSSKSRTQVQDLAYSMASDQRFWILRVVSYITTKLLNWFFGSDLYIDETGVESVKTLQNTHTLIYVPTHRSHLDSVIMGYTMFANGLEPAHIVAGENLKIPLLSELMRASGAFFIRRSNKDVKDRELYKKTLSGFIEGLLCHGKHLEFFIEGGRSRDGRLLEPKLGILADVVNAFIDSDLPKDGNVAIIPVNISYDHPVEENALLQELMGKSKQPETLWRFVLSFGRVLMQCLMGRVATSLGVGGSCGTAIVSFGKPLHLKMLLRSLSRGLKKGNQSIRGRTHVFRGMTSSHSMNQNDLIKASFPIGSDERYEAVSLLGMAIQTQLRNIQVVPASSILYCAIFLECFRNTSSNLILPMERVMRSIDQIQHLLKQNEAQFMSFGNENRRFSKSRINVFLSRLDRWIDVKSEDELTVKNTISSSIVFYIRSNHLLIKLSPVCLVLSAVVACIQGFGQSSEPLKSQFRTQLAPRQSDFMSVPYAKKTMIITAVLWLREVLSPELDLVFGEQGFRSQTEIVNCLDKMVRDGILTLCIPSTGGNRKRTSSLGSSQRSGGRRRSVDHVVDKLIFDVVGNMEVRGRASMQFESDLTKIKNIPSTSYGTPLPTIRSWDSSEPNSPSRNDVAKPLTDFLIPTSSDNIALTSGWNTYALMYSPLIATYGHLFGKLQYIFDVKDYYEEKELIKTLMDELQSFWEQSGQGTHENLCWNPIPCLTIVQRFVSSLMTWKPPRDDFPFSPYPSLINGSRVTPASKPPRPSLSNENLAKKSVFIESRGSVVASDSDATSEIVQMDPSFHGQLQLRREFREGDNLIDYQEKLSIFIPYQNCCFV
eukprot:g8898.t1